MRKKIIILCGVLLVAALFLFYIFTDDDTKDSFYSYSCGYDCKKIPLINPCYIGSTTGVNGEWYLSNCYGNYGAVGTSYINVLDSIIVSYYYNKHIVVPENRDTTWFIHIPIQKQEYKFSSEEKFYEQVRKLTDKQVEFIEVPVLYKELVEKGYLDWFPKEYKSK